MSDTLVTIIACLITAIVSIFGSQLMFKGSLAAMAKNAFDLAQEATAETKTLREQIKTMQLMFDGRMKVSAEFSMGDLLKNGTAPLMNGIIEILHEDGREITPPPRPKKG